MANRKLNGSRSSASKSAKTEKEIQEVLMNKTIALLDRLDLYYSLDERTFRIDCVMPSLALEMPLLISAAFGPEFSTVETSMDLPDPDWKASEHTADRHGNFDAKQNESCAPCPAMNPKPALKPNECQLELSRFLMELSSNSCMGYFRADFENRKLVCRFSWLSQATKADFKSLLTILFSGLRELETLFPACCRILEGKSTWAEAMSLYPLWYAGVLLEKRDLLASQGKEAQVKSLDNELDSLSRRMEEEDTASIQNPLLNETISPYIPGSG